MRRVLIPVLAFGLTYPALGEKRNPGTRDTAFAWYSQVGRWHLVRDTVSGSAHLFHDAAVDGAQSGQAKADLKYNHPFNRPTRISSHFSLGPRPSCAGVFLKSGSLAYCVMLDHGLCGDSLLIVRRFEKKRTRLAAFAVSTADPQRLEIRLSADSLRLIDGRASYAITRPADLPDTLTVGLACSEGSVSVRDVAITSASMTLEESFDSAMVINLGLERMFPGKGTRTRLNPTRSR